MAIKKETRSKVTKDLYQERINVVAKMLIEGYLRHQIIKVVKHPAGKYVWEISDRCVDAYISKARADISRNTTVETEDMRSLAIARYTDLYRRNHKERDYKECRAVQDSFNKLLGLNAPIKLESENSVTIFRLPDNQRDTDEQES